MIVYVKITRYLSWEESWKMTSGLNNSAIASNICHRTQCIEHLRKTLIEFENSFVMILYYESTCAREIRGMQSIAEKRMKEYLYKVVMAT